MSKGAALAALGLLTLAPIASAASKVVVSKIGSPELGEFGGRFRSPRGVAVNQTIGDLFAVDPVTTA